MAEHTDKGSVSPAAHIHLLCLAGQVQPTHSGLRALNLQVSVVRASVGDWWLEP